MEAMPAPLLMIIQFWLKMLLWLGGFAILFGVLERLWPCNPGRHASPRAFITDIIYGLVIPLFTRFVVAIYTGIGIALVFRGVSEEMVFLSLTQGFGPAAQLPVWAQAAIVFILSDIILYWTHRTFHTGKFWPYHAVHHCSKEVSWHSTYRFHPLNTWLTFTAVDSLMVFLGFSLEAVTLMATFNMFYSAMVHANLNWTFGPFRFIFASPVFHRWHHTMQAEGLDKNFAPTFPLLDIMFGTFYMPEGRVPEQYGVSEPVPESFLGQLAWPFKRRG